MKKVKLLFPYTLCVAVAMIVLASCSKDGATGPAGPAGPAGPTGAAGGAGPAGPAGTANVIYSNWTDTAQWQADTVHNGAVIDTVGYYTFLDVPKLDLTILNTGTIHVYADFSADPTDPTVLSIPYLGGSFYIDNLFWLNTIQLSSNVDFTGLPLRYVLVPGGTAARTSNEKTIDWKNYKEVQAYLGLKD